MHLLLQDVVLFEAIISDLFPDMMLTSSEDQQLAAALSTACQQVGLQAVPGFISKAMQLHDTLEARFGTMLVGPAGECCGSM